MRLTKREKSALLDAANHMIAGGIEDLRDALGCGDCADDIMAALESAAEKLKDARPPGAATAGEERG